MEQDYPQVVYAGLYRHTPENAKNLPWHAHSVPELVLTVQGKNRTLFAAKEFDCSVGTLIVTPAHYSHKQEDILDTQVANIGFIPGKFEFDLTLRNIELSSDSMIFEWFREIRELFFSDEDREQSNFLLMTLLARLRRLEHRETLRHPALRNAVLYLEKHLTEPFTLERISRESGLSASRLNTLFREEFGSSIMQYLLAKRMHRARLILADPTKNVAETGELCGFPNSNYFIRMFHRFHGCTPRQYRENQQEKLRNFAWPDSKKNP